MFPQLRLSFGKWFKAKRGFPKNSCIFWNRRNKRYRSAFQDTPLKFTVEGVTNFAATVLRLSGRDKNSEVIEINNTTTKTVQV